MNEEKLKNSLSKAVEPVLKKDYVTLGFLKNISLNGKKLTVTLGISDLSSEIVSAAKDHVANILKKDFPELHEVNVKFVIGITQQKSSGKKHTLSGVKNTIAIASGKGGVGKSTVAVNLAIALAKAGAKTGLIDADIYGPSIPIMFGVNQKPGLVQEGDKNKLLPVEKFGVKLMSIGFLLEQETAVVWRGPMASSALKQFMEDVVWGELDFLLFDMPPGTGDIQLTLSQTIPLTGAIIVTTPQDISLADARKGLIMFDRVKVPTMGIIENMSYYVNADGKKDYIFGQGGGMKMSSEYGVKLLGEIPLTGIIRKCGDEGIPVTENMPDDYVSQIFRNIAADTIKEVNLKNVSSKSESDVIIEI
ncbi:MAG: Iron-sulfur cluster carrier protein [Ignavibacteria bacterium]|nr:Iron-sulfur cluster carrier protein [Ignavibacteria bacterium]